MSKAVLISIHPQWCELIASGKKTVEVRKTKPNAILPLKCYIYETQGNEISGNADFTYVKKGRGRRKVIGEFICHNIFPISIGCNKPEKLTPCEIPGFGLTDIEIMDYLGNGETGYAWYISDLKIYDQPKELSEFYRWWDGAEDIRPCENGKNCEYLIYDYVDDCQACAIDFDGTDCPFLKVKRPPQSWCYVEELKE